MAEATRVKRSQFATFLNTSPSGENPTWSRMGKGITGQSVAYNPTVNDEQFIHEDSGTKEVDSYAPTMSTEQTAYAGDPVFDYVDELRQARAVGNDAKTQLLMVYIFDKESDGKYKAETQDVTISINEFGGDAGNAVKISYDVGFCGEPEKGTATITGGAPTFTKAVATPTNE